MRDASSVRKELSPEISMRLCRVVGTLKVELSACEREFRVVYFHQRIIVIDELN